MAPRQFFGNRLYDLLVNEISVQIDVREIKVIGQALKGQFFFSVTESHDRLFQTLPFLSLLLGSLLQLIGSDDPQSDQKITKAFFLFYHMTSKLQLPITKHQINTNHQ